MTDVFISYSRKDIAFARLLHQVLESNDIKTWIDWQDIPPSIDWLQEVYTAIEITDTFVFLISDTSIVSEICQKEIDHARKNNKRLIPIVINEVSPHEVHPALASLNWIFSRTEDEFASMTSDLISAIQTDHEWVKEHTRLQVRALEWERSDKNASFLLRGIDLNQAENWVTQAEDKNIEPSLLQTQFIQVSRKEAVKRQRYVLISVGIAFIVAASLGVLAFINGEQAKANALSLSTQVVIAENAKGTAQAEAYFRATQQTIAEEQRNIADKRAKESFAGYLSVEALSLMDTDLDKALLLSIEAGLQADLAQARNALMTSLEHNPNLVRYLYGHSGQVWRSAYNPDKNILATAGCGERDPSVGANTCNIGEILIWDMDTIKVSHTISTSHTSFMSALEFSPDGSTLASGDWQGNIVFWNTENWEADSIPENTLGGRILDIIFSPDGHYAVSSHETREPITGSFSAEFRIWDAITYELANIASYFGTLPYYDLTFLPDSQHFIASMNAGSVINIFDVETLDRDIRITEKYESVPYTIDVNGNGNLLATGNYNGSIELWDLETITRTAMTPNAHEGVVYRVRFNPSGTYLVSGGTDRDIKLWSVPEMELLQTYAAHKGAVQDITWIDDYRFVSVGEDGKAMLWDLRNQTHIGTNLSNLSTIIQSIAINSTGTQILAAAPNLNAMSWLIDNEDVSIPTDIKHTDNAFTVSYDTYGDIYVIGDYFGGVKVFNAHTNELKSEKTTKHKGAVMSSAISPDGNLIVTGGWEDNTMIIWDTELLEPLYILDDHLAEVTSLAFSNNGKWLASTSCADPVSSHCSTGQLIIWAVNGPDVTMHKTIEAHQNYIYAVAFSPDDNQMVTGSGDYKIQFWQTDTFEPLGEPLEFHEGPITSLAYDPLGRFLVAVSVDTTISLIDINNHTLIGPKFQGHRDVVTSIKFSQDGSKMVSGGYDGAVILWNLEIEKWRELACVRAGHNLTIDEWETYFGDRHFQETCSVE